MNKLGLSVFLLSSTLLIYTPVTFAESEFYEYSDSVDASLDNDAPDYEEADTAYYSDSYDVPKNTYAQAKKYVSNARGSSYATRLPQTIATGEKVILVDPRVHAWGAYVNGQLIRAGVATSGSKWCSDLGRPCRTKSGVFRIQSLGSYHCKSTRYPLGKGGAPMPYCMYFNGNQGLHGSPNVADANLSHGCVRLTVADAEWIRFNFANIGTKVIIRSY